ncbi:porin family protein [Aureivirga sp. CE67]|uniref:porin family protein n=1 Tax=Aureivirga sp. CE67 TaxID=1788983 RepID=UPI0018CB452D|nr:porin family protein [Aureivirga sp. CE67]
MRNLLLIALLFAGGIFVSNAQTNTTPQTETTSNAIEMEWGVKGGLTISNLVDSDVYGGDSKVGWNAGIFYEIPITGSFSIQPEVIYSVEGSKNSYQTPYGGDANAFTTIENDITFHYINVPIYAKYYIIEGFSVYLGPQISFLVNNENDMTITYPLIPRPAVINMKEKLNSTNNINFAGSVGLGYKFDFNVIVNATYNYGFTNVISKDDGKNSVFNFTLGYEF